MNWQFENDGWWELDEDFAKEMILVKSMAVVYTYLLKYLNTEYIAYTFTVTK